MEQKHRLFNRFLQNRGLLTSYYTYHIGSTSIVEQWTGYPHEEYFERTDPALYIQLAFAWTDTQQGYAIWQAISNEWRKFLKKNQQVSFLNENTTVI